MQISGRRYAPSYGNDFCSTFKIRYTKDGLKWTWADNNSVYNGPKSNMDVTTIKFESKFEAIAVRLHCLSWTNSASVSVEFYYEPIDFGKEDKPEEKKNDKEKKFL